MIDLRGATVLVTGASGGVGAGIARRFAKAGAAVVAHYHRNRAAAEALAADLGVRAVAIGADLAVEAECARLVAEAAGWAGRLDAVVNNAGIQPDLALADMTAADWRSVVDTNVTSAFACTQAAAKVMARAGGGSVTHIASIQAHAPAEGHAHYSASKAALVMHARAAALEYGRAGIRVNTVSPGLIDRPGLVDEWPEGVERWRETVPLGRLGTAADVGDVCVFLASPLASFVSGQDIAVDGGITARPPW
ncbi:SDR family NAD(P)-dependent oxidoreductase [Actinokineospora sp. UTMC 2448]|uniref:SDR family NAD(P)-dependent oxidoreductase n=1 Tax=Actinokineospora sp. UTMC 2448 TaxID=2268449 RepID=UPI00216459D9|nr:SDR family NAD(P)-dependent oxidoreductase [Actinokineospora sp. UTMC 2448]UVS78042.1 Glucose 1-dehydrogenase [Actinokineospora sp. UTMC 2448]